MLTDKYRSISLRITFSLKQENMGNIMSLKYLWQEQLSFNDNNNNL